MRNGPWTAEQINDILRGYQAACVIMAAGELELFDRMGSGPFTAAEATRRLKTDLRGTTVLLDVLTAIGVLSKEGDNYRATAGITDTLTTKGSQSILAMVQHQATCLRGWSKLAAVVKSGRPGPRDAEIRAAGITFNTPFEENC